MPQATRKKCFEIAKSLQKGDILFWRKYKFSNGNQKNKYILILSNCINGKYYVYTMPTSQVDFYKNPRNKIDTIWLRANQVKQFPLNTVVDLKHFFLGRASLIGEKLYDNTLEIVGKLPNNIVYQIDGVVRNAKTLNPKIKSLILGATIC